MQVILMVQKKVRDEQFTFSMKDIHKSMGTVWPEKLRGVIYLSTKH